MAGLVIEAVFFAVARSITSRAFLEPGVSIGSGCFWLRTVSADKPLRLMAAILRSSSKNPFLMALEIMRSSVEALLLHLHLTAHLVPTPSLVQTVHAVHANAEQA